MAIVTLTEAKLHLKVEQTSEDALIDLYIAAAQEQIEKFLNCSIPNMNLTTPNPPASIKAAALLYIGELYENREGSTEIELKENPAVMRLLYPYRKNLGI